MNYKSIFKLRDNWNLHKEELKENKYYLFNVQDGDIIKLNEVSFDVLSNIDGEKSIKEIFDIIKNMYDVRDDTLEKDISILIKKCIEEKVIEEVR